MHPCFGRVVAIALLSLSTGGCTRGAKSSEMGAPPPEAPSYGGSFHLMLEAPGTLDPSRVDDVYEACIINQIYDGLLEFDAHLNPVPAIAHEWSISRDGREYVFTIRDDARFHCGRFVRAEDFVYSFTRLFDPDRADHGLGGEFLQRIEGVEAYASGKADRISGLEAVGETELIIRLEKPYGSFLQALAMDQTKVVCRDEIERWGDEYDLHPVGTGPFRLAEITDEEDARLILEANESYFGGRPYLDELVFHIPKDFNVDRGVKGLLTGEASLCDLPAARREEFDSDPRFEVVRRPELSFSFIGMNLGLPPLQDVRVRRAIAHAVNRERIVALDPAGRIPAVGILPPGMFGFSPEQKTLTYDPERASQLLAEAGYPGGEGLDPIEYWQADRGEIGRTADEMLKEDLEAVGLEIRFEYADWDVFDQKLTDMAIPAFGLTWVADVPDPDSFLASLFMTSGVYNLFNYSDSPVDSLLAQGSQMRASRDRALTYQQAERVILNDVPVIPIYHLANNYVVRREVRGLTVTPFGLGNLRVEKIWIENPAS